MKLLFKKGNIRNSGTSGRKKTFGHQSGDIYVVYHKKWQCSHIFKVNGTIQECTKKC